MIPVRIQGASDGKKCQEPARAGIALPATDNVTAGGLSADLPPVRRCSLGTETHTISPVKGYNPRVGLIGFSILPTIRAENQIIRT